jgi:hypothetical protein
MRFRTVVGLLLSALVISSALPANASVISFEEFPADNTNGAMPANRYAALGVTFAATDDGATYDGLGAGDPGNWLIAGTNGSTFMGFNGSSYGLSMFFAPGITSFSLDASRSFGSSSGNSITVQAWAGALLLQSQTVVFGDINTWSSIVLGGLTPANEIRIFGNGSGFHPFGVDNITFQEAAVPEPASLLLLGTGGLGLVAALRRRRQQES